MASKDHLVNDPSVKHHEIPSGTWTFHYLIPSRDPSVKVWEQFLKEFHDFSSFEDFFGIMNTVEKPEKLPQGCRYYVFRKGIRPLWEDPKNANGHQIYADYQTRTKNSKGGQNYLNSFISRKWLEITCMALGQTNEYVKQINGIEFNNRGKSFKIALWYSPEKDKSLIENDVKNWLINFLKEPYHSDEGTPGKQWNPPNPPIKIEQLVPSSPDIEKKPSDRRRKQ